jgi:hypothetical protein
MAFLAPLYHSHDYPDDYNHESSGDHVLFYVGSSAEGLSACQHNGFHLHVRKNIGSTNSRLHSKDQTSKQNIGDETSSPVFPGHLTSRRLSYIQAVVFRSRSCDSSSGLSPPIV